MINIGVVEDHGGFRETLVRLLEETEGFDCVGACPNAATALRLLPDARPDVILMDLHLPGENGFDCVRRLKEALPDTQILMLTVEENGPMVFAALQAGATGYLVKTQDPSGVLQAIRDAARGGAPMSASIARLVVRSFQSVRSADEALGTLTPMETKVLDALAGGWTNKELAAHFDLSADTIRTHIRNIFDKLHVHSRTEAAALWFQGSHR